MKIPLLKVAATFAMAMITSAIYATDQEKRGQDAKMGGSSMNAPQEATPMSDGEVDAVDVAGKTITLRHGPIKSKTIEMEPMTMMFYVRDPALLMNVKEGDKVRFNVEFIDNVLLVTNLIVTK